MVLCRRMPVQIGVGECWMMPNGPQRYSAGRYWGKSLLGSARGCQAVLNRTLQEDAVVEGCRRDLEGAEQFLMVLSRRVPVQKNVRECRIELNDTLPKGSGAEWYLRVSDNTLRCSTEGF